MIPFEMLLLPHIPLRGRILSKSNSAGNSDCFCVCFHLHFNDRGIVAIGLFAAGPGKRGKITCHHLTFAPHKQHQNLGITNFWHESAFFPFLLPRQVGFKSEMGSWTPCRGFAQVQH